MNFIVNLDRGQRQLLFLGLTLILIQIILLPIPRADHHLLSSDGAYYFSYVRSVLFDGDLSLTNDMALYNQPILDDVHKMGPESHITYAYAIGSSLLWLPFFILGQSISLLLFWLGWDVNPNGFSYINEFFVSCGSIIYGTLGLYFSLQVTRKYFSKYNILALGAYLGGSSVLYYFIFEPTMSHLNSLFICSLFIYYIEQKCEQPLVRRTSLVLGGIMGLMVLTRWQNLVFSLLLLRLFPQFKMGLSKKQIQYLGEGGLVFIFICGIQSVFWKLTHGRFFLIPQGEGFVDWSSPQWFDILFTTQHGLISWTPIAGLALIGLLLWVVKVPSWASGLYLLLMLLNVYINASVVGDIGGGASFGMRRFINCFPLFILGLLALIDWMKISHSKAFWVFVFSLFICWNGLFMIQYRLGFIDPAAPLSWHEMVFAKVEMLSEIKGKVMQRMRSHSPK